MRRITSLVLVACLLLTSCGDDEGFTSSPIPAGNLTYINAIPDSPELLVVTNNLRTGTMLFGQATQRTPTLPQIPLDYRVSYLNAGVDETVFEGMVTLQVDASHTFLLTGTLAAPVLTEIVDPPFTFATDTTDTRIRFVNATSSIASATATITNPNGNNDSVAMTRGQPTAFTTTTAGDGVQIEVTDTGTGSVLWRSGEFTLSAASDRIFVLLDYFGPGTETVRLVTINDPSGADLFVNEELPAALRFANQAADRGSLDFYVNDVLRETLAFNEVSDPIELDGGTSDVTIRPAGDTDTELSSGDRSLFRGFFHTLQVAANADGTGIGTGFFAEQRQPIATAARINITKLAPAVTTVDLYFQNAGEALTGNPDLNQVPDFTTASLPVNPQTYDLYITEAGNNTVLIGPQTINLEARGNYTIHITDSPGGGTPLQLQLLDDFQD